MSGSRRHRPAASRAAQVELLLRRMASAYGMRRSRVVVFPTAIFITLRDASDGDARGRSHQHAALDQIADVYELGDEADAARSRQPPASSG
jgi:uncharacterized membrane protein YjjP (DUF1212 family)